MHLVTCPRIGDTHEAVIYYKDHTVLSCFYCQANVINCSFEPRREEKCEEQRTLTKHSGLGSEMTPSCKPPIAVRPSIWLPLNRRAIAEEQLFFFLASRLNIVAAHASYITSTARTAKMMGREKAFLSPAKVCFTRATSSHLRCNEFVWFVRCHATRSKLHFTENAGPRNTSEEESAGNTSGDENADQLKTMMMKIMN